MRMDTMQRRIPAFPHAQRGMATVEYAIIATLGVLVLVANPNIVLELANALRRIYTGFVYALSFAAL